MKAMKRIIGVALIFTLMTCGTAFAGLKDVRNSLLTTYTQSRLLADTCVNDGDITPNSARGIVFSAGMLELVNKQDGTLHISVDTFAHSVVDDIYQSVFLEMWDESKEKWVQVGHWEFEKTIKEDENLTSYHVGFTVSGCEVNRYYRARAIHLVQWGDDAEGKSTQTDGVLLTDHAV